MGCLFKSSYNNFGEQIMFETFFTKKMPALASSEIFISAGEPSGDFHAANLVRQIRLKRPDVMISGVAGSLMRLEAVETVFDAENLAVMGITDVLAHAHVIFEAFSKVSTYLEEKRPGLIILVDYPGFNLRVAKKAHELGIPVFYYISPKVWAWGTGRVNKIRKYVDHMGLILPFEEEFYKKNGIRATFVGNPLIDAFPEPIQKKDSLKGKRVIGLLPGSRKGEISRHLPVMLDAAIMIIREMPDAEFIISLKDVSYCENIKGYHLLSDSIKIESGEVSRIFEKCDIMVAASGTVTLEAAIAGVPTIIMYIMSDLSFGIAKALVKVKFAGLANLVAGREVSPELLQDDASPGKIASMVIKLLGSKRAIEKMKADYKLVRNKLGRPGAAGRAADIALSMLGRQVKA